MNIWHDLNDERVKEDDFIVVIEIPKGCKSKYELDKETGMIILDRVLHVSVQYPLSYGFIPRTLSEDGDALDVLVLCAEKLDPLSLVRCYPIGVIEMIDGDTLDHKVVAIPFKDPYYNTYKDVKDLPRHIIDELRHFFLVYKDLENKQTQVKPIEDKKQAMKIIKQSKIAYAEKFKK